MEATLDLFKELKSFSEPELQKEILKHAKFIKASKGEILIKEGQYLNFLPIVIKGLLRVYQQNEDREILLYYVGPEQTCMMSLSSAYFDYYSTANGIAMEESEILVLPAHLIAEWQLKYPSWNKFILRTFKSRYDELLNAFGNVAFKPINVRLKEYLTAYIKNESSNKIPVSHQTLANDLGTTRVVISRILKQFEKEKLVKLYRGYIQLNS
ncbi:Crp/Fnr family transcriptional regulator [Cognataquiflexum rubidum]|uniref:Crp/Fnr family transcriptional regulator n=1 Tax=Cognataquiflexum rubidum TaxID=2922273 RepID=UPI001F12F681|nr:Crp/Fnr family transcriptional regulator [Cognataquiflexum rubidum]MCH6235054.1 Crp/Fnr family transcriptional regulator [Cognataquiflexum rubidum]